MQILIVDVGKAMRTLRRALGGAWLRRPRAPRAPPPAALDPMARALVQRRCGGMPIPAASGGAVMSVFGLGSKALLRSGYTESPSGVRARFETTGPSIFRNPLGDVAR